MGENQAERAVALMKAVVYVHGMAGSADEASHFRSLFPERKVIGFDYRASHPREVKEEFSRFFRSVFDRYGPFILIANSIGAYFSMQAPLSGLIERAYFISPVTDMEELILGMMRQAGVTEEELMQKGVIPLSSGPDLSWEYLSYVRKHPVSLSVPLHILAGRRDSLIPRDSFESFAAKFGADLAVMPDGEHWFHTPDQMRFLDEWILDHERREK